MPCQKLSKLSKKAINKLRGEPAGLLNQWEKSTDKNLLSLPDKISNRKKKGASSLDHTWLDKSLVTGAGASF